jgi:hypothetical protein
MILGISGRINSGKDTVGKIIQYLTLDKEVFAMTNADIIADLEYNGYCANKSDWKIKKFADKLKDIVCILLGCTREQLEDREFKEKELGEEWWYYGFDGGIMIPYLNNGYKKGEEPLKYLIKLTPRKLLQLLGTECGRNIIHPNVWVNALFNDYDKTKTCEFYHERKSCMCYRESDDSTLCENDYPNWIITDLRFPNELQAIKDRGGISIRVNRPKYAYESDLPAESSPLQHAERGKELHNHFSETALDDAEFDFVIDNNKDIGHLVNEVKTVLEKLNFLNL